MVQLSPKGPEHERLCQGGAKPPTAWDSNGKRPWAGGEVTRAPNLLSVHKQTKIKESHSAPFLGSPRVVLLGGGWHRRARVQVGEHLACLVTPARTEAVGAFVSTSSPLRDMGWFHITYREVEGPVLQRAPNCSIFPWEGSRAEHK